MIEAGHGGMKRARARHETDTAVEESGRKGKDALADVPKQQGGSAGIALNLHPDNSREGRVPIILAHETREKNGQRQMLRNRRKTTLLA